MRAFASVVLLMVLFFTLAGPPSYADLPEWAKVVIALGAAYCLSQNVPPPEPEIPVQTTPPEPLQRAPRPLGTVLITQVDGQSTYWVTGEVLRAAGWQVVYEEDRRAAEAEQRRYGGNAQIPPAQYFASVRTEFRNGREYDRSNYGRNNSSVNGGRERLCTVYLRIATGTGLTYTATGTGSSWDRYERFDWRSCGFGGSESYYTPTSNDWALLAAMVAACNGITRQAVPPASYGTPTSQATTPKGDGQIHFCPACGKPVPQGANFCPYCGKQLVALTEPPTMH